jgi:hypothetical protein
MCDLQVMSMFVYEAPPVPTVAIWKHAKCDQDETLLKSKNIFVPAAAWLGISKHEPAMTAMSAVRCIDAFTLHSAAK